ncbi:MYCBP-associated protein-like isoform X3 [Denticeps clupeoides]|uniref:MYCBP-associated protein-like isoform X3 n=1 Tax=Denticeps clupeoides TaxID=299321 RepID=UPI0010A46518|nr:MYCBP-associated protein-like isoform X3 [Denticeps clupeoides]
MERDTMSQMCSVRFRKELSMSANMEQLQNHSPRREDVQALIIKQEDLEKLRMPQPPRHSHKAPTVTRVVVRRNRPADEIKKKKTVLVARPLPEDTAPQLVDYSGPGGPRFDSQGMILPHSILGSLEEFKKDMEARGELELIKRVPDRQELPDLPVGGRRSEEGPGERPHHGYDHQSHALRHWQGQMSERRRQRDFISRLLQRPAEGLLMSQSYRYRHIQEQRELLSRALPALHSGFGRGAGSEFWSQPQRFGDESSGIAATLTQTERGNPEPVTHISQPHCILQETGNVLRDPPSGWESSEYLHQRRDELREMLQDLDFNQPDMDALAVIGSGQPFSCVSIQRSPLLEEQEEEEKRSDQQPREHEDPLAQYEDVVTEPLLVPALRFCGQLSCWTGSSPLHRGAVGIRARLMFEAEVGLSVNSHVELQNEGSTAIYYNWQRIPAPHSFPEARPAMGTQQFYFNTSAGVILPGDTQRVTCTFKPARAGITTEVWHLNTHPVLLGGAAMQVTLRGVAFCQDRTAERRAAIERELQHKEALSACRSMLSDVLRRVRTPERPESPIPVGTEEEEFLSINPSLHFHRETIEALKTLWCEVTAATARSDSPEGHAWDLSLSNLRQAVLSLPESDPSLTPAGVCREAALAEYNALLSELHKPHFPAPSLSLLSTGLQLWRELLDGLEEEAARLGRALAFLDTETEDLNSGKKGVPAPREDKKAPPVEDPAGRKRRSLEEDPARGLSSSTASPEPDGTGDHAEPRKPELLRQRLFQQVYVLMEGLVDSFCDLHDECLHNQSHSQKA